VLESLKLPTLTPSPSPKLGEGNKKGFQNWVLQALSPDPSPSGRGEKTSDLIEHFLSVVENLLICEPQHAQAVRDHVSVAILVVMPLLVWLMHWSVALNH